MTDRFHDQVQEAIAPAYTVERELKGGGMSRVFVAVEQALGRTVVVKVLRPDLAADVNRERFRREIMLVAKLQHPHIVPVLSAGERGDLLWYTMPFIEGESLREAILRRGQFPVRDVVRVMHDVLDALAYAHARGVVHRDIKPGNILTHGAHALVTDFGVAKALSASMPHSGTTSAGMAIGTPAYMAPEQLAADPSADHRVDLYAVGLLAYELLTGEQPFAEDSPAETLAALLTRMPPPVEELRTDVPPALASVITRLLAKQPNARPPNAESTLQELDQLITPQTGGVMSTARPIAASPAPAASAAASSTPTAPRARRLAGPLIAAGAAILAAVGWILLSDQPPTAPRASDTAIARVPAATKETVATTPPSLTPSDSKAKAAPSESVPARPRAAANTAIAPGKDSVRPPATRTRDTSARVTTRTTTAAPRPQTTPQPRAAAQLVGPSGKPKRVAILPVRDATGRSQYGEAARALEDSLKRTAAAMGYSLATDAELVRLMAESDQNAQRRVAEASGIGALITAVLTVRERELQAQAVIMDVWRALSQSERGATDLDDPAGSLIVVRGVMRAVGRVSWRQRTDPRQVIVFDVDNQTGVDTLAPLARAFADSVRVTAARYLGSAGKLIGDSTARATRDAGERRIVAVELGAGASVSAVINRRGADSLRMRAQVRDMSEDRTLEVIEFVASIREPMRAIADLMARLTADLGRVNWGPKGLPAGPG